MRTLEMLAWGGLAVWCVLVLILIACFTAANATMPKDPEREVLIADADCAELAAAFCR